MPQSLAKIYVHIVFSTKHRFPFLSTPELRNEMHAYLGGTFKELDCPVLTVGGPADHVHILCVLSKNLAASEVIGKVKRSSSKWVRQRGRHSESFHGRTDTECSPSVSLMWTVFGTTFKGKKTITDGRHFRMSSENS